MNASGTVKPSFRRDLIAGLVAGAIVGCIIIWSVLPAGVWRW